MNYCWKFIVVLSGVSLSFKVSIMTFTITFPGSFAFWLQFRLLVVQAFCTTISLELFLETLLSF
jgi:hypothetical protein